MSAQIHLPARRQLARCSGLLCCALLAGCPDSGSGAFSDNHQAKLDGVAGPAPLSIVPERPVSRQDVKVTVAAAGSTSIELAVSGLGCGTLVAKAGTSPLVATGKAAADGFCRLTATVRAPGVAARTFAGSFEVQATAPDLPPVSTPLGVWELDTFPAASGGPAVSAIEGPPSFINGASATYTASYAGTSAARAALLQVPGYQGYFRVPVAAANGKVSFDLAFASDFFDRPQAPQRASLRNALTAGPLGLLVALEDALGRVGSPYALTLTAKEVQTGDVKVSIAWNTPTDVDLHVTEPGGERIYYRNRTSATGGQLDLDSNAGCAIDNVNNENVYWPTGKSPTGEFTVRVHMYESPCSEGGPAGASGTLTLAYCGADSPRTVPFTLSGTNDAVEVKFTSKCTSRVSGTVRYEDFPVTDTGLGAGALVPARFVTVMAVRASDDVLLAEGSSDAAGKYDLSFVNDKTPGFYVMVQARRASTGLKQKVQDLDGNLWAFRSPKKTEPALDDSKPPADGQGFKKDVELKKADGAGALNIFEVGLTSALHAFGQTGKAPPELTFRWSYGVAPGGDVVSYFSPPNTITVNGDLADPDEYDDAIIAHEYGHFVLASYGKDESPGGSHSSNDRSVPTLAWSEGWATFFACSSQHRTSYADTNAKGMGVFYSLETLPSTKPLGNADSKLEGDLSEAVVASVLLDIADSNNEDKDTLSLRPAIWSVVTDYLKDGSTKLADRGAAGRDLVDFLDGWACMGFGEKGADDTKGLRGIVKGLAGLSYDFKEVASCK